MIPPYHHFRAFVPRTVLPFARAITIRHMSRPATTSTLRQNVSVISAAYACRAQKRAKKTKSSVKLDDLPQGVIALDPLPYEEDAPSYPTVVQQARSNMRKFDNCVLLTRVGGFYELYFEHADEFGPLMNLKVAQKKTNAGPVSMVLPQNPSHDDLLMSLERQGFHFSSLIDISKFSSRISTDSLRLLRSSQMTHPEKSRQEA